MNDFQSINLQIKFRNSIVKELLNTKEQWLGHIMKQDTINGCTKQDDLF
jgi:hypothetical protein